MYKQVKRSVFSTVFLIAEIFFHGMNSKLLLVLPNSHWDHNFIFIRNIFPLQGGCFFLDYGNKSPQ